MGESKGAGAPHEEALKARTRRSLRIARFTVEASIILLFLQLLLGMWANLFAVFPSPTPPVNPLDQVFTEGPVLLALHVIVGILLGILAIVGVAAAAYARNRGLIALELGALSSVLIAGESGIEFVLGGYQEDFLSYTMTVGYVLLLIVYTWTSRRIGEWEKPLRAI